MSTETDGTEEVPSQSEIDRQREDLRRTLNEIEDRINPAKVTARVKTRVQRSIDDDPTPWVAAAAGVAVLIAGAITLAIVGKGRR